MFTAEDRARIRAEILEEAGRDPRISGGAVTGSAARNREDRWSDIDLAFGVADAANLPEVVTGWTSRLYERCGAVHHVDVRAGSWLYRVFLLSNGLQVDLAFAPANEFRPLSPAFRLIFGAAGQPSEFPSASVADLIGFAWLHALHARSSIARGRLWQAEYMIGGIRNHGLALACIRHGLPAAHARGVDALPPQVTAEFEKSLVGRLDPAELHRASDAAVAALIVEIRSVDPSLADRLEPALRMAF